MSEHMSPIPSRVYNAAVGGHVCGPEDVDFGQKVVHLVKYDRAGNEVSFESQVTQANKIYVIHDDFTLSSNVTIPVNCTLQFEGGSISGAYTITGNNTIVDGFICLHDVKTNSQFLFKDGSEFLNYEPINGFKYISNQKEFNDFLLEISNTDVNVKNYILGDNRFYFFKNNEHSVIINKGIKVIGSKNTIIDCSNIQLYRKDAVSVTDTHYVINNSNISKFAVFLDEEDNLIPVSSIENDSTRVLSTTQIIDFELDNYTFKIDISDKDALKNRTFEKAFGILKCGWITFCFSVLSSDSTYLYCKLYMEDFSSNFGSGAEAINWNKTIYGTTVDYILYNTDIQEGKVFYNNTNIYIPKEVRCCKIIFKDFTEGVFSFKTDTVDTNPQSISFDGIAFKNLPHKLMWYYNNNQNIIRNVYINNCSFENTGTGVIVLEDMLRTSTSYTNLSVTNSTFKNVVLNKTSTNRETIQIKHWMSVYPQPADIVFYNTINIRNNKFINNDIAYYPSSCVGVNLQGAKESYIINNEFINFGSASIMAFYGDNNITYNKIHNTDIFNQYDRRNFERDWGAMYYGMLSLNPNVANAYTKTTIVKYNKIYNIAGHKEDTKNYEGTRGMHIDDGRGNVDIQYNTVINNPYLGYSIDCRDATTGGSEIVASSVNNIVKNNIVSSPLRVQGGSGATTRPVYGSNILLDAIALETNEYATRSGQDFVIKSYKIKDYYVIIPYSETTVIATSNYDNIFVESKYITSKYPVYSGYGKSHSIDIKILPTNGGGLYSYKYFDVDIIAQGGTSLGYKINIVGSYISNIIYIRHFSIEHKGNPSENVICAIYTKTNGTGIINILVSAFNLYNGNQIELSTLDVQVVDRSSIPLEITSIGINTADDTDYSSQGNLDRVNTIYETKFLTSSTLNGFNTLCNKIVPIGIKIDAVIGGSKGMITHGGFLYTQGSTTNRNTNNGTPYTGFEYFDTSYKYPVYWDGSKYVKSDGTDAPITEPEQI